MGLDVDMKKFHPIGRVTDVSGAEYIILIEEGLPKKRAIEISRQCINNKLDIRGHIYDPGDEEIDRLKDLA